MKGQKPKVTSWRAFVQGKQIGTGYASETEALEAARRHFEKEEDGGSVLPDIDARASFLPIPEDSTEALMYSICHTRDKDELVDGI